MKRNVIKFIVFVACVVTFFSVIGMAIEFNNTGVLRFSVPEDLFRYLFAMSMVFVYYMLKDRKKQKKNEDK